MIVFDHVPKCGGTTIIKQLRSAVTGKQYVLDGRDPSAGLDALRLMGSHERYTYELIAGHSLYHIDYLLRDAHWVTMLRDPIERVWSYYQYTQSMPWLRKHFGITEDLFAFIERSQEPECSWQYAAGSNLYTRCYGSANRLRNRYEVIGCLDHPSRFVAEISRIGYIIDMDTAANATRCKRPMTFDERQTIERVNGADTAFYREILAHA